MISFLQDPDFYTQLDMSVATDYKLLIEELQAEVLASAGVHKFSTQSFLDKLSIILASIPLQKHSPINYYWANLLEDYLELLELHIELDNHKKKSQSNATENEVSQIWSDSCFTLFFSNKVDQKMSITDASLSLLPMLEQNIVSTYYFQIASSAIIFSKPYFYNLIPEIGDIDTQIYLDSTNTVIHFNMPIDTFPSLLISEITDNKASFDLFLNNSISTFTADINSHNLQGPQLRVTSKESKAILKQLDKSLLCIKKNSKNSFNVFQHFTKVIVASNDQNSSSYTIESLPNHSIISLNDCDDIELIKKLIFNNAFHFLNAICIQDEIFNDETELEINDSQDSTSDILYLVFSHFWVFYFCYDCISKFSVNDHFSMDEKSKIKKIYSESDKLLNHYQQDLISAYDDNTLTKQGMNLVNEIYSSLLLYKNGPTR